MDILSRINWVDILVIIILFRVSYIAFQEGLSHEIFPLIGATGTVVLALYYYENLSNFISGNVMKLPIEVTDFLSFIALIILFGILFKLLRVVLDKVIKVSWHPLIEKLGGVVAGIFRACIVASIILMILSLMPLSYLQRSIREKSLTGMYFLKIGPFVYEKAAKILPKIKLEKGSADRVSIIKKLASDKSVVSANTKVKTPKKAEWED